MARITEPYNSEVATLKREIMRIVNSASIPVPVLSQVLCVVMEYDTTDVPDEV